MADHFHQLFHGSVLIDFDIIFFFRFGSDVIEASFSFTSTAEKFFSFSLRSVFRDSLLFDLFTIIDSKIHEVILHSGQGDIVLGRTILLFLLIIITINMYDTLTGLNQVPDIIVIQLFLFSVSAILVLLNIPFLKYFEFVNFALEIVLNPFAELVES